MNISALTGLVPPILVGALVGVAIRLWQRRVPGLRGRDAIHGAVYLNRYATALEYYGMRRREIVAHVDDLRADLAAAGPDEAIATLGRLGPPRTLAAAVADGLLRPSPLRGAVWFGVSAIVIAGATILATDAFLTGFEAAAATPGERADWATFGMSAAATMGDDGRASSVEFTSVWLIVVPAASFLVGGRLWRYLDRNDPPTA